METTANDTMIMSRQQALDTLGLKPNVTSMEHIKHRFRKLALSLHPDRIQREKDLEYKTSATSFHQIQQAYDYLLRGKEVGSRMLYKVANGGKSISAVSENIESVQLGMGIGDEEESITASVTFTCCPLCLKSYQAGRALRAHFQSKAHKLDNKSKPTLEEAMKLALTNFSVTATSNYMVGQNSASVGLCSKGRPLLLDQEMCQDKTEQHKLSTKLSLKIERARESACKKASASAASASVRKWGSGNGNRANAKLSHVGLTASRDGNLIELKKLISSGEYDPTIHVGPNGETGLHWAAGSGHLEVLMYLVEVACKYSSSKCNTNSSSNSGSNYSSCIEQLNVRGKRSGRTVIHWAARNGHRHLLAALNERWGSQRDNDGGGNNSLKEAKEFEKTVGIDFDCETFDGSTPLHLAAYAGEIPTIMWLVKHGCNPNFKNNYGCNALFFSCIGAQYLSSKYLYDICNVDAFAIQKQGHSALHKAAYTGSKDICTWLQDVVGLDRECILEDAKGHTADDLARIKGHHELSKYLHRHRESRNKK
jgi:ankyrin repeat protein